MKKGKTIKYDLFAGDFETYTAEGTDKTWVWSSALAPVENEENIVILHHSIKETWNWLKKRQKNTRIYYHNLKFDGTFWMDFLLKQPELYQAYTPETGFLDDDDMSHNQFKYTVSDMGQWYSIKIKLLDNQDNYFYIELVDSLKLIPFSLKEAGKAFNTKHQKLDMNYEGFRDEFHMFTNEERNYIANDVLCLKECLQAMFENGHNGLTIGSCCMKDYKKQTKELFSMGMKYEDYFPDLTEELPPYYIKDFENVDRYIRKSYHGGWCYLKKGCVGKIYENGGTFDVNSLYPSMMHSMSGNRYPVGLPTFWAGNYIPECCNNNHIYYFVRIKTRFYLKDGYLPFIQIKNNPLYYSTQHLETSDIEGYKFIEKDGKLIDTRVELTLTCVDFKLFLEHYNVEDFEILDGCYFHSEIGLFDRYINHYAEIKKKEKGVKRTIAKLFLNNLYGQFAKSDDSSYKVMYLENGVVKQYTVTGFEKKPGYIPVGSAITSYAREFTIRTAQKNYENFIYADTDSIHMLNPENAIDIPLHDTDFCKWKFESSWEKGIFARQKSYIEVIQGEYDIKCAGMTKANKDLFHQMICLGDYTLEDFRPGLEIPLGKLRPKRVDGGIVLVDTTFRMK